MVKNFNAYFFFFLFFTLFVLEAKETKIAYVDSEKIMKEYTAAREAMRQLEKDIDEWEKQADSLKQVLNKAIEEFEAKKLMLSLEGQEAEAKRINDLEKHYNNFLYDIWGKGGKIDSRNRELLAPIAQKVNAAIEKISKEERLTLVFDAASARILYAEPGLDITDEVLAELNKEYIAKEGITVLERQAALLSIYESNAEARAEALGNFFFEYLLSFLEKRPKVKLAKAHAVEEAMQRYNLRKGEKVEKKMAYEIGRELNLDFLVYGSVSKRGKKISVELTLLDVKKNKEISAGKAEGSLKEDLKARLADLLGRALYRLER